MYWTAILIASVSLLFHLFAASLFNGSSGFGELNRAYIDNKTALFLYLNLIYKAGDHLSFKISKQILPKLSIFGWYILVQKTTFGADIG